MFRQRDIRLEPKKIEMDIMIRSFISLLIFSFKNIDKFIKNQ